MAVDVPLGFLYLSAYLKRHITEKVEIDITDLRKARKKKSSLKKKLVQFKPDIIGISLLSFEKDFIRNHADIFQEHAPAAKIIIGGPYPTTDYSEIVMNHDIECVVIGEGEKVLLNLINAYAEGREFKDIKGIAYRNDGNVIRNDSEDYIEDLDSIPYPDYSLINLEDYWGYHSQMNGVLAEKKYIHVISSRACPYSCIYCHNIFGKKLRKRSPDNFFGEIKLLYHEYGVKEFHFVDDVFNIDRKRMHEILNLIIESGIKIRIAFPNGVRGDILTQDDIKLLKKAGTYMITYAIETASERIQKLIKKNLDVKKVIENIKYSHEIGLITRGYFMIGFPGETIDEIKKTVSLAIESKLDMVSFWAVVPFKHTGLYDLARKQYKSFDDTRFNYRSEESFYERVTGFNLDALQKRATFDFYRSKRFFTLMAKLPNKSLFIMIHSKIYFNIFKFLISESIKTKLSGIIPVIKKPDHKKGGL